MTINFVTFSQDYKRLAVGTTKGFRIHQADPSFTTYARTDEDNVSIIETMYSTNLAALVLSPRRLIIRNTMRKSTICEFTYPSAILAVRLNRKRLVVVLEEEMFIYDIQHMNLIYTIATSPNPNALCALSPDKENWQYLAYPLPKAQEEAGSRPSHAPPSSKFVPPTSGELLIFDVNSLKSLNVIEAHRAPLSCMVLNQKGTLLATSSETGTIIRVFSVPGGQKLYQFRRGTYPSTIYTMTFDCESSFLAVSSTTDTIHIFKLGVSNTGNSRARSGSPQTASSRLSRAISNDRENSESPPPDSSEYDSRRPPPIRKSSGTLGSMFRRTSQIMGKNVASVVGGYLPQTMTEMFEPARDFAFIKMKSESVEEKSVLGAHVRTVVAFQSWQPIEKPESLEVYVATSNGIFHTFAMDMKSGGECTEKGSLNVLEVDQKGSAPMDE